jgi:hypothetical protein
MSHQQFGQTVDFADFGSADVFGNVNPNDSSSDSIQSGSESGEGSGFAGGSDAVDPFASEFDDPFGNSGGDFDPFGLQGQTSGADSSNSGGDGVDTEFKTADSLF